MSIHEVKVTYLSDIIEHPNADRLEIARIGTTDWQVIVSKGEFSSGDPCIYIPIDSVLGGRIEAFLFPPDSKVKLEKSRVRSIKLRGSVSQGMVIKLDEALALEFPKLRYTYAGMDISKELGVTKYEPPASSVRGQSRMGVQTKQKGNPAFGKYTDIENFKNYPDLFHPEDEVYVTEKIHGTSARYAMLPVAVDSLWKWIRKFVHLLPKYEFCYGSRNVQLQSRHRKTTYYAKDVYSLMATQYRLAEILEPGEILYGEIVGDGIQKGYTYGCGQGEWKFLAYDVKRDGEFLDPLAFHDWCMLRGILAVPCLHVGLLSASEGLTAMSSGLSKIMRGDDPAKSTQLVREGIVVKPLHEERCHIGRKVLKYLNDEYLLDKGNTDFH